MVRRTYRYTDYSPTAIALAAKENWSSLVATLMAPWPPRMVVATTPRHPRNVAYATHAASLALRALHKAPTIAPWPPRMATSTPAIATIAPQPLHKAALVATATSLMTTTWPLYKVVLSTAATTTTSASRSAHQTSFVVTLHSSSQVAHAQSGLRKAKRRLRKSSLVSQKTTSLNR
ncbi:hypothetical protein ACLOJK_015122 [Asimina triloba]